MKKQILIAALGLVLLAGCSDDTTSPSVFKRGKRYLCATSAPPQSNTAERYCKSDFETPVSGDFKYKNKLRETLHERYADGYIVFAERRDAQGKLIERADRKIENGLLVQVSRVYYPNGRNESPRWIVADFHDWGYESKAHYENGPILVRCIRNDYT